MGITGGMVFVEVGTYGITWDRPRSVSKSDYFQLIYLVCSEQTLAVRCWWLASSPGLPLPLPSKMREGKNDMKVKGEEGLVKLIT